MTDQLDLDAAAQKGALTPPSLDQHTQSPPAPPLDWGPDSWPEEMPCIRATPPEGGENGHRQNEEELD